MKLYQETMDILTTLERPAPGNPPTLKGWLRGVCCQSGRRSLKHPVYSLFTSGGLSLFRYLLASGLFRDPGLVILSPHDHASFAGADLKRATTLITLRRLNLVKHLEMFLNSLVHILPPETNFIGCFSKEGKGSRGYWMTGIVQAIQSRISNIEGLENHSLSRNKVSEILERNGLSMTELNGVIYFHSRKLPGLRPVTFAT
jgi:hypothetical protein